MPDLTNSQKDSIENEPEAPKYSSFGKPDDLKIAEAQIEKKLGRFPGWLSDPFYFEHGSLKTEFGISVEEMNRTELMAFVYLLEKDRYDNHSLRFLARLVVKNHDDVRKINFQSRNYADIRITERIEFIKRFVDTADEHKVTRKNAPTVMYGRRASLLSSILPNTSES